MGRGVLCLTVGHRARFAVSDSGTQGVNHAMLELIAKFQQRSFIHCINIEGA